MTKTVRFAAPLTPEDVVEVQVVSYNGQIFQVPTGSISQWMSAGRMFSRRDKVNESAVDMLKLLSGLRVINRRQCEEAVDYIDEQHPNYRATLKRVQMEKARAEKCARKKALKALRKDADSTKAYETDGKYKPFSKQEIYSKKARKR